MLNQQEIFNNNIILYIKKNQEITCNFYKNSI